MSSRHEPARWVPVVSGVLGTLFVCAVVWACGASSEVSVEADPDSGGGTSGRTPPPPPPPTDAAIVDSAAPDGDTDGGPTPNGATTPNLKVAFIGDTGSGADFKSVLQLIVREKADFVMIQGDLTYGFSLTPAADWFTAVDNEINKAQPGSTAAVTVPFFVSKGNHDISWGGLGDGLGQGLKARLATWGVPAGNGDPTKRNYSLVYKGLKMVMVDETETNPTRADYVDSQLKNDTQIWKICSWHKNMRASNVGPKNDEMGWAIYENCRNQGAIVAQGHSHTYSRSKTLIKDSDQTVDTACADPFAPCVGPGKHFFFDSSIGGEDTRSLEASVAAAPYWASTYTGSFGALFITFNVDGNPKKAEGYFKTVGDVVVDPPAGSGKTKFTITKSP